MQTQVEKLISILSDGNEYHSIQLNHKMGWKWGARLSDARKKGYVINDRHDPSEPKYKFYRLVYIPEEFATEINWSIIQNFNSRMDAILAQEAYEERHPSLL